MRGLIQNNRGETLVEVLVSILVAAMSMLLLLGCVTASARLDRQAKEMDSGYYEGFTKADAQAAESAGVGSVRIAGDSGEVSPGIIIYGGGGIFSYKGQQP